MSLQKIAELKAENAEITKNNGELLDQRQALMFRVADLESRLKNVAQIITEYLIPCRKCDEGIDAAPCTCGHPRHDFSKLHDIEKHATMAGMTDWEYWLALMFRTDKEGDRNEPNALGNS